MQQKESPCEQESLHDHQSGPEYHVTLPLLRNASAFILIRKVNGYKSSASCNSPYGGVQAPLDSFTNRHPFQAAFFLPYRPIIYWTR
ncbi:hypothetical protein SLA2020_441410 [Shorea laevis]